MSHNYFFHEGDNKGSERIKKFVKKSGNFTGLKLVPYLSTITFPYNINLK